MHVKETIFLIPVKPNNLYLPEKPRIFYPNLGINIFVRPSTNNQKNLVLMSPEYG